MAVELSEQESSISYFFWLHLWRRIIAAVEVLGGLCGSYAVFSGGLSDIAHAVALAFFILAIVAGVLLFFSKNLGIPLSLVIQALQLVQINAGGLLYCLVCGPQFLLGYSDGFGVGFVWALKTSFQVLLNAAPVSDPVPGPWGVTVSYGSGTFLTGLNVVAMAAIICLLLVRADNRSAGR